MNEVLDQSAKGAQYESQGASAKRVAPGKDNQTYTSPEGA